MKYIIALLLFVGLTSFAYGQAQSDSLDYNYMLQQKEKLTQQITQLQAELYQKEKQLDELLKQYQLFDYAIKKEQEVLEIKKGKSK